MKIRDAVRLFLPTEMVVKANPVGEFLFQPGREGQPQDHLVDADVMMRSGAVEVWAYVALAQIGKNLSAAPLIAERRKTVDGEPQWVGDNDSPLAKMIASPNPTEPADVLIWRLILSLLPSGDAYLAHDKEAGELYHVHPSHIKEVPNRDGVMYYEVKHGQKTKRLDTEEVVHIVMPNAENEFYGQSAIEPIKDHIMLNRNYVRYLSYFFQSGAVPSGILSTDLDVSEDVASQTRHEWNKTHEGYRRSHRIAILGRGLTYQAISPPLKDLVVDTLYKMPREAILAAFGVPPVLAGIFEYANYANSKEQTQIFWHNTILPLQRVIAGYLNVQLVPQYGNDLRVRFDTSKIAALREDETAKVTRTTLLVNSGIITPNEARRDLGREDIDGGDELRGHFDSMAIDESGEGKSVVDSPSRAHNGVVTKGDPRQKLWADHYKAVTSLERSMANAIRKFFDDQLDRVLERLNSVQINGEMLRVPLRYLAKGDAENEADAILNLTEEAQKLKDATDPLVKNAIEKSGQSALRRISAASAFNVSNPKVATISTTFHNRSKLINNTTYEAIKRILQRGYDEQLGLREIEKDLRQYYADNSRMRAMRVAQTEMNGIVNGAAEAAWTQEGVQRKEWVSAMLSTSRQAHMDADGQVVAMDGRFLVDGELLSYPGDQSGSPGNVINCHCAINPVTN